jgi:hypothetical protein
MWAASSASPGMLRGGRNQQRQPWQLSKKQAGVPGGNHGTLSPVVLNRHPRQNRWTGPSLKQAKVPEAALSQMQRGSP